MADAGCQCVYVVDSAGALVLDEVTDRVAARCAEVRRRTPRSASTATRTCRLARRQHVLAIRAGAVQVDGCTRRFGAGAGNTPTEALVAVCEQLGITTGIDVFRSRRRRGRRPPGDGRRAASLDRMSLIMGYAGVYSSFLEHA